MFLKISSNKKKQVQKNKRVQNPFYKILFNFLWTKTANVAYFSDQFKNKSVPIKDIQQII